MTHAPSSNLPLYTWTAVSRQYIILRLLQWKKSHFIQSEIYKQFSVSNLRLSLSLWIIAVRLPIQQPNSCIFQPCDLLPTFPLLHFPPVRSAPDFSTPAFSCPAICSRLFDSCIFQPCIFDRIAFSTPAFSVAPSHSTYHFTGESLQAITCTGGTDNSTQNKQEKIHQKHKIIKLAALAVSPTHKKHICCGLTVGSALERTSIDLALPGGVSFSQGGWCFPCVGSLLSFYSSKVTADMFSKTSTTRWYSFTV